MRQPDLFMPEKPDGAPKEGRRPVYAPDPKVIRGRLLAVLDELREAKALPWDPDRLLFHRTVFPQMSRCLPDDERDTLLRAFIAELERLEAA